MSFAPTHVLLRVLVGLSLVHALCAARSPAEDSAPAVKTKRSAVGAAFFDDPAVRLFDLRIPEAELSQLGRSSRTYVKAELSEGDTVLTSVGVRLKGNGSFRTIEEKPSFAIKFDEYTDGQNYHGFKKLMFNNSVQDPSYLSELLATVLFRDAGVPAARVTHARMRLNGRDLGLYVVIEAMNKDFLKHNFGNSKGNLYEAYLQDVNGRLELDNGEDQSRADLNALCEACAITDPAARWTQLNKVLDVERFVSFVAMEILTTHWDGYSVLLNNYRLYHDPSTDKMVFITHGLDGAFRRPNFSIDAPLKSTVVTAVLTTPEGRKLYDQRFRTLATDVFKVPVIVERIDKAMTKLRGAGLDPAELASLERYAALKRERIEARGLRVDEQLQGVKPETMKVDADGVGFPVAWRDEPDRGNPVFDRVTYDGKKTLHIGAADESTRASWRSQVFLAPGSYRFEGSARIASLLGGMARLRISGNSNGVSGISGTSSWRPVQYEFVVGGEGMDIELVCEFTTMHAGHVWFDLNSLRVRRLGDAPPPRQRVTRPQPVLRPQPTLRLQLGQ